MVEYKELRVSAVDKEYKACIDKADALADMKGSNGWRELEKWLLDRRREGVSIENLDSTLTAEEVKMQVVLHRFKVELVDAIFAYIEESINSAEELKVELDLDDQDPIDGKDGTDIIKP